MTTPYTYRQSGSTGHEIVNPDGLVIAWTVDVGWAGMITGLLNGAALQPRKEMTMTKDEIKNLVQTLLKHRPDLVIVVTDNEQEKMTLVTLLKNAGGKVIYQNTTL
jgi:hypothetical protein